MIVDQTIARPYAEAAFGYANAHQQTKVWLQFLQVMADVFEQSAIKAVIANPFVDQAAVVDEVLNSAGKQMDESHVNFLKLLASNRRLAYTKAIMQLYREQCEKQADVLHVDVTSAFALSDQTRQALEQKLSSKYQKQIMMQVSVDPTLIGGVVMRMGDDILDSSVKSMLQQLNSKMIKG